MAGLKIEIKGIERIKQIGNKIQVAIKSSASLAPVREDARRIVADSNRRSFDRQQGPQGERWPPRVQRRGRRIVNAKPLLVDTGRFRDALASLRTRIDNFGTRLTISYEAGRTGDLLKFHNFGTKNMAARPVGLSLDRQAQEEIAAIAFRRIGEAFSKGVKGK